MMKNINTIIVLFLLILVGCKSEKKENITYVSFGDEITDKGVISAKEMNEKFNTLKVGDTINIKFSSVVNSVCQKKGCWIKVPLSDEKQSFVKFKDYAFFMPFNSAGSKVILNGKAFKNVISIKDLQHYAKDAGKSAEEIAKITEPKTTYSFLADGVLLEAKKTDE